MAKTKYEKTAKDITIELLDLLGIKAEINISISKEEEEEVLNIEINPQDNDEGLLIGTHGANLEAIQYFLNIALKQQTGDWHRIVLDIGSWREKQKDSLNSLGTQAATRAKQTGEPQYLYNLSPFQRKSIHVSLKDDTEIETYSEGEGEDRYLVIKAK